MTLVTILGLHVEFMGIVGALKQAVTSLFGVGSWNILTSRMVINVL